MFAPRYFPKRYFAGRYFPPPAGDFGGWTETTDGGLIFAGGAAVSHTYAEPTDGGLIFAGVGGISHTYDEPTSGGILFSGSAPTQWIPAGGAGFARRLWYRLGLGV